MGEIGAKSYMKSDYEEFHALRRRKNKANLKPNKFVPSTLFRVGSEQRRMEPICRDLAGNSKFEFRNPKRDKRVPNDRFQHVLQSLFEKTKPILKWAKWR